MSLKVYLAGPIAGLTFQQGQQWRDYVKGKLEWRDLGHHLGAATGIKAFSPLRGKEERDDGKILGLQMDNPAPMSTPRGVIARDGHDVRTCDLFFCNVDGVTNLSGGTAWELGVAWACNKIVIMVAANEDNPYLKHLILSQVAAFVVPTLDEGITITKAVLLDV